MLVLHQLSHQLVVLLDVLINGGLGTWNLLHLACGVHLPHLLLFGGRRTSSLQARRLSSLALRRLARNTLSHVWLGRELASRFLIDVLKVVWLPVVVGGEMGCSCPLVMMGNLTRCLAARIQTTILRLSMTLNARITSVLISGTTHYDIEHLMRRILTWLIH